MLSRKAPIFYGDIGSYERVPLPFSSFIEICKKRLSKDESCDVCNESEILQSVAPDDDLYDISTVAENQIYLAQRMNSRDGNDLAKALPPPLPTPPEIPPDVVPIKAEPDPQRRNASPLPGMALGLKLITLMDIPEISGGGLIRIMHYLL